MGGLRYLSMASVTLLFNMVFLFILVEYGKVPPAPVAVIAILAVFIIRYIIPRSWIWLEKPPKS